jgi:hypothetical protein
LVYEEASAPKPVLTRTNPDSPGKDNTPLIGGEFTESAVAPASVQLFKGDDCRDGAVARGSAAAFTGPGIEVRVRDDSTTIFHAIATDVSGRRSPCSSSIVYRERSPG